jgi:hypothetical protein
MTIYFAIALAHATITHTPHEKSPQSLRIETEDKGETTKVQLHTQGIERQ